MKAYGVKRKEASQCKHRAGRCRCDDRTPRKEPIRKGRARREGKGLLVEETPTNRQAPGPFEWTPISVTERDVECALIEQDIRERVAALGIPFVTVGEKVK